MYRLGSTKLFGCVGLPLLYCHPLLDLLTFNIGMVRFRMMGLRPDFDDATRPELDPMPTPSWCEYKIQRLMSRQSFSIRYLVEALLMHGRVSLPELDELFALLPRIPSSRQQSILEGLFAWTRSGTITADLIGKSWYLIP